MDTETQPKPKRKVGGADQYPRVSDAAGGHCLNRFSVAT